MGGRFYEQCPLTTKIHNVLQGFTLVWSHRNYKFIIEIKSFYIEQLPHHLKNRFNYHIDIKNKFSQIIKFN